MCLRNESLRTIEICLFAVGLGTNAYLTRHQMVTTIVETLCSVLQKSSTDGSNGVLSYIMMREISIFKKSIICICALYKTVSVWFCGCICLGNTDPTPGIMMRNTLTSTFHWVLQRWYYILSEYCSICSTDILPNEVNVHFPKSPSDWTCSKIFSTDYLNVNCIELFQISKRFANIISFWRCVCIYLCYFCTVGVH